MEELLRRMKLLIEMVEMRQVISTGEVIDEIRWMMGKMVDMDYLRKEVENRRVVEMRERYFLVTGKKAFNGWSRKELEDKLRDEEKKVVVSDDVYAVKKSLNKDEEVVVSLTVKQSPQWKKKWKRK